MELHKIRKQINEYVLLNSKTIKLHMKYENIILKQIVQPIKKPVRTLSIFTSMAFVKDANGISFKNRLKGHKNWRKVRNFIII